MTNMEFLIIMIIIANLNVWLILFYFRTKKENHTLHFTSIKAAAQIKERVIPVSTVVFT